MADIKDCIGKNVKISKGSITIKSDNGKTSGVIKNITSLYDLQANKQMEYYQKIRNLGLHGKISIKDCIIADGTIYVFRNIKSKLFHEKNGFISEEEKQRAEETETIYNALKTAGIDVIECVYVQEVFQMKKKLYKVFYKSGNGNEHFTFIEADGEEMIKDILYHVQGITTELISYEEVMQNEKENI